MFRAQPSWGQAEQPIPERLLATDGSWEGTLGGHPLSVEQESSDRTIHQSEPCRLWSIPDLGYPFVPYVAHFRNASIFSCTFSLSSTIRANNRGSSASRYLNFPTAAMSLHVLFYDLEEGDTLR